MAIVNFDKFRNEEKIFILGGKEYKFSGDLSVEDSFLLMDYLPKVDKSKEDMHLAIGEIWKVLAKNNPERKESEFKKDLTIPMLPELFKLILGSKEESKDKPAGVVDNSKNGSGVHQEK